MANGKSRDQLRISTVEKINQSELNDNGPKFAESVGAAVEEQAKSAASTAKPVKRAPDPASRISDVDGLQIFDSRGNPTVEATVTLEDGSFGTASAPSGASTGSREAVELRDHNPNKYTGASVERAVENVRHEIKDTITGKFVEEQVKIDRAINRTDGTYNKSKLGANATLAVSLAVAKAGADYRGQKLYQYLRENKSLGKIFSKHAGFSLDDKSGFYLPVPMANIINGGKHAENQLNIQEFMIVPKGFDTLSESLEAARNTFMELKKRLESKKMSTTVGDEGGFAPSQLRTPNQTISLIKQAIENAGYKPGEQIAIAIDFAASEFYKNGLYSPEKTGKSKNMDSAGMVEYAVRLKEKHPEIISMEDALDEGDWEGWKMLTEALPQVQLVGDDLFVTNKKILQEGIDAGVANSILIKPNQIGTLTETVEAIALAKSVGYGTIISHRSGETGDTTIADISVAFNALQIKTGSLSRSDRVEKYNQLLRIEKDLGRDARFAGSLAFQHLDAA
ncbi:MAG: phosphopyruvate hydratase [Alphaproteobacteria bacterium]|nr:phosphopyruvate hydratase [Alphaproteobacteria bacterium]